MAQKRKISIRKILQVFLTLVATSGCIVAMVSASKIEDDKKVKSIAVHIKNSRKYHFIEEKEILDLAVNNRGVDVMNTSMAHIDIHGMERSIMADPWVADAQVYVDNENILQMYVTQRVPVVRLFRDNGTSFYMDTTLSIMPLSKSYVYYTTVVTNVPELKDDSTSRAVKRGILSLAQTIQSDSFWSAQVAQVIIDSNNTFELVPVLGNQKILFGDTSRMKDKLANLFAFYKDVLNRIGWDKYEVLDLRFRDQVVASPSLPYKGPVDKAVVNMNWINSIIQTEARRDSMTENKQAIAQRKHENKKDVVREAPSHKPVIAAKKDNKKQPPKKEDKKKQVAKQKSKADKNKNNKIKDQKDNKNHKSPKYVYPEKKVH